MTLDLDRYNWLKLRVEKSRREAAHAEGALEQLMAQLQSEFNCKTLKEAEALLKRLTREQETLEDEFNAALKEFERDHGKLLAD